MVTYVVQMREFNLDGRGQETRVGLHDNSDHLGVQQCGVANGDGKNTGLFLA